jgi:hypothetical protein
MAGNQQPVGVLEGLFGAEKKLGETIFFLSGWV